MCPYRKSSAFMATAEEADDIVFDDYWVSQMPLDENCPTLPGSIVDHSMLGFDPQCMAPTSPTTAVGYNQDQYPVIYSYPMHDYRFVSQPAFQPSPWAPDPSGFSGDPNIDSSHHSYDIPVPNFYQNLGPGTLPPSFTNASPAYHARQHLCNVCPQTFKHKRDLNRHMDTVHATDRELGYRCRCGKTDIRKDNHRRHIRTCSKKNGNHPFSCKCLTMYEDEAAYLSHISMCQVPPPVRE